MKKIISLLILLVLIVTVASAGCVGNSDLEDVEDEPAASYVEQNFDFVGTWSSVAGDDYWMVLGLFGNGEGMIAIKISEERAEGMLTWTKEALPNGRTYCLLDMGNGPTITVISTADKNKILYFQTRDDIENWNPITLTRYEGTPSATQVTTTAVKTPTPTPTKSTTTGQDNALKQAKSYISHSSFSYTGLIHQLEYEGYTHSEAVYGADNCGADWYEEAVEEAESYLRYMSFSRSGLYDQLEYEGYTAAQINYALNKVY